MALPDSSVSKVCVDIKEFLKTKMNTGDSSIYIKIGTPADAANTSSTDNTVNLFFYRFDTSGFDAALRPGEIWRIRLYCLITPFGKDEGNESAGENDLRMLGNIMQIFHENPTITIDELSYLQIIFLPLSDEQLNQVWSTQGQTTYRPSVVYEMSLAPIVPGTPWGGAPLVGALGTQWHASMSARHVGFSGITAAPPVVKSTINLADPAWIPKICFIYNNQCVQSLSFDIDSFDPNLKLQVWVAGDSSESVNLVWEVWKNGWTNENPLIPVTPHSAYIDPDGSIPDSVHNLTLPPTLIPTLGNKFEKDEFSRQALLYAIRSIAEQPLEIKSNPLLVNIYRKR